LAQATASTALAGTLVYGCGSDPVSPPRSGSVTIDLDDPRYAALGVVGGAVKVAWPGDHPAIVRCTATETYEALSSTCTHASCEVGLPSGGAIVCPCHGSRFDTSGRRLAGPASRDLFRGVTELAGRNLTIRFG
jgi:Rieske Fe-S protein